MPELKPCPFCGGTKLKLDGKSTLAGFFADMRVERFTCSVRCNRCHSRGPAFGGNVIDGKFLIRDVKLPKWDVDRETLERKAAEAWNRRADNG